MIITVEIPVDNVFTLNGSVVPGGSRMRVVSPIILTSKNVILEIPALGKIEVDADDLMKAISRARH